MNINKLSKDYRIRKLTEADTDIIFDLCKDNKIFYRYHPPFVTRQSILDDLKALPPHKTYDDKYFIGFFENEALVAVMDLITSYPDTETAFIGFFMLNISHKHKGIASNIIRDTKAYLKTEGYQKIRLGVDKGNPQSFSFWKKNGFKVIGEDEYIVMEFCNSVQ